MRRFLFLFLCLLAAFLSGCSHNISRDDFQEDHQFVNQFNWRAEDKTAEIVFNNDSTLDVDDVRISGDSLKGKLTGNIYGDFSTVLEWERPVGFPVSDVKRASFVYHIRGIFPGIALGVLSGSVMGVIFFRGTGGVSNSGKHTDPALSAFAGAVLGLLPGAVLGAIIGEDYIYNFTPGKAGLDGLNTAQRFGIRLGFHPGFSPEILGDGYPDRYNSIKSSGRPGAFLTFYYNEPLSRLFSLNNEVSFFYAGSDEKNTIKIPGAKTSGGYYTEIPVTLNSQEEIGLMEIAPLFRLNIKRTEVSPYLIAGPRLDFLLSVSSGKVKLYEELNNKYKDLPVSIAGKYNRILAGGIVGGGISTGKLLPFELTLEARYNFDITNRFTLHYDTPLSHQYYFYDTANISYYSREWIFSLGLALPGI